MKNTFFVLLAAVLILISGVSCTNQGSSSGSKTTPFLGGTTGLLMTFVDMNPPAEVYDGGEFPFNVEVKLENAGEYTVPVDKAEIRIKGLRPEDFGVTGASMTKHPDEELTRASKDSEGNKIPGTTSFVEFANLNHVSKLLGNTQLPIMAELCYKYGTVSQAKACIRKDLLSTKTSVCTINEKKTVDSSGAPLQVTGFEEQVAGSSKIAFIFKIQKKANGDIYMRDTNCNLSFSNENKVYVSITSALTGLKCNNLRDGTDTAGYTRLVNGESTITCTQQVDPNTVDSETLIYLNAEYDYLDRISTNILVKHLG